MTRPVTRAIVLWCPDWPITAILRARGINTDTPIALVDRGVIFASSPTARQEGVRRGLRLREAQARCTDLEVFPYDSALDARFFDPVIDELEKIMPGVQVIRPGTCVFRARGPSRYYGNEQRAAAALLERLEGIGISGGRVGIADGPFAAEQAARNARAASNDRIHIIPPGGSPAFLAPLSVGLLGLPALVPLLRRLGIHTLGDLASLDATDVRERFGEVGVYAHTVASGLDHTAVLPRTPPRLLDCSVDFEPPLDRVDQVTFAFRATADAFIAGLTHAGLVCTAVRIEVKTESGATSERSWLHPRVFNAPDVVDRVRWQLQGSGTIDSGLSSGIISVRVIPESVDDIGHHEEGLWGGGADERIHHGLSRVQSMLGHDAVLTAVVGGGRALIERQVFVPWGDRAADTKVDTRPWPGSLPPPMPATVFQTPRPVTVLTATKVPAEIDDRGALTGALEYFSPTESKDEVAVVTAWTGPWPVNERWWDPSHGQKLHRFQLVDADGMAWLLALNGGRWEAEARYD